MAVVIDFGLVLTWIAVFLAINEADNDGKCVLGPLHKHFLRLSSPVMLVSVGMAYKPSFLLLGAISSSSYMLR